MKKLYLDIELSPHKAYVYEKYETNVVGWDSFSVLLSYAYQWEGQSIIHCESLPDFELYKKEPQNDRELVKSLWSLLHQPAIIIGHNIVAFDLKKSNTHFIKHGLPPPINKYITIDTLVQARKIGKFPANSLEDLAIYFDLGRKKGHHSNLWEKCLIEKDKRAWRLLQIYNKGDVELTRKVYQKLEPYILHHPSVSVLLDGKCPRCESDNLIKRGVMYFASAGGIVQTYHCKGCGARIKGDVKVER